MRDAIHVLFRARHKGIIPTRDEVNQLLQSSTPTEVLALKNDMPLWQAHWQAEELKQRHAGVLSIATPKLEAL